LTRHGTKWPAEDILSKIKDQLIPDIQQAVKEIYETPDNDGELRYDEMLQKNQKIIIRSIIKWENYLDQGSHKDLNDHGKQNMIDLGNRLKQKLWPLATVLNKDNVEVRGVMLLNFIITVSVYFYMKFDFMTCRFYHRMIGDVFLAEKN